MHVRSVVVWLKLNQCLTQRDKDQRIERIMRKLRLHFNVSTATLGPDREIDKVALGITTIGRDKRVSLEVLERVIDAVSVHPDAELVGEPEWQ